MLSWFKRKREFKVTDFQKRITTCKKGNNLPHHVAIIMDGNGRWAKKHYVSRMLGHKQGMENVRNIYIFAKEIGVKVLTLYAFSTENWKRSDEEVAHLMKLPSVFLNKFLPELIEKKIKVVMVGSRIRIPKNTLEAIDRAIEKTKHNNEFILNFAFNYGSRSEIIEAVNSVIKSVDSKKISLPITEDTFSRHLFTANLPDPDLLIRTSGENRISNFMLWQLAYTELYFTNVLWPDFNEVEFLTAIESFLSRKRRFGGRKESEET